MLFLDVETTANTGLLPFLPPVASPGSYKKPESIAQWLAENCESARQEQIAKMPLDPLLFCLRAISLAAGSQGQPEAWLIHNKAEEKAVLRELWQRLASSDACPIVGYKVPGFDLPRLLWRSAMQEVRPHWLLDLRRYGDPMLLLRSKANPPTSTPSRRAQKPQTSVTAGWLRCVLSLTRPAIWARIIPCPGITAPFWA